MDSPIVFTLNDVIHLVGVISGFLVALNAAIIVLSGWHKKLHVPEDTQNARITTIEDQVKELQKSYLALNEKLQFQIDRLEKRERDLMTFEKLTIKSLQALSEHAIDGNNMKGLMETTDEMNNYLLDKM
jgi:uncharacterized Ntn-hydrolase superfamily protein